MQSRSMKRMVVAAFALLLSCVFIGCGGGANEKSGAANQKNPSVSEKKSDAHAPASVVPGSYEDWCGEHQVAESLCSRCNPGLIPAFKASNDWCAEHGLPESQCLACNPDLKIVRPPKPLGS